METFNSNIKLKLSSLPHPLQFQKKKNTSATEMDMVDMTSSPTF